MYAEVAVNRPPKQTFTYHIPLDLAGPGEIVPGHLVEVSFGTSKESGIVTHVHNVKPAFETKPITKRFDQQPVLTRNQLELGWWLAEQTFSSIGSCLFLMLPPGLATKSQVRFELIMEEYPGNTKGQKRVLELLKSRGTMSKGQLKKAIPNQTGMNVDEITRQLVQRGVISRVEFLKPPSVKPKFARVVALAIQPHLLSDIIHELGYENRRATTLIRILEFLASLPNHRTDSSTLYRETGASLQHIEQLLEDEVIFVEQEEVWRDPLEHITFSQDIPPSLTEGQERVWKRINEYGTYNRESQNSPVFLLHGVTGSGKTEIYLRTVEKILSQGQQAIVLVSEIALTPQTIDRFGSRFNGQISVIHSHLTEGERYDTWRRIRMGEVKIVIGARSAIFVPLDNVGVIILDEEHDDSYKQQDPEYPTVHYHAREVAIEMMRQNHGTVILGSATPDVTSMFRAEQGEFIYLHLPDRVLAHRAAVEEQVQALKLQSPHYHETEVKEAVSLELPPVQIVDMRHELKAGNRSIFSRALQSALHQTLSAQQQAILFLNRRGTATFVMCRDCGYIAKCPRCDTPLTYHAPQEALRCHHCGYHGPNPQKCPECGSTRIKHFGTGTEQLDRLIQAEFPEARVVRWDKDTASEKGAHERILSQFIHREADILVGTQMIAKGLDLPLVTLVGIISADTGLGLPDYRAGERTFQVLTQVAGRAGRSLLGGRVILQTYQPDNYAIQAAANHDFMTFYRQEMGYRRMLDYPPYKRLARLLFTDRSEANAQEEADTVARLLRHHRTKGDFSATEIIGPTPCFFTKHNYLFRWQVLIRSTDPVEFLRGVEFKTTTIVDIDPTDLL
ncbi:MAG: primosomal protein N' [Anaerolineae bacterium]|nr:primosomal protein N' [Anaerolineae bacterium]